MPVASAPASCANRRPQSQSADARQVLGVALPGYLYGDALQYLPHDTIHYEKRIPIGLIIAGMVFWTCRHPHGRTR